MKTAYLEQEFGNYTWESLVLRESLKQSASKLWGESLVWNVQREKDKDILFLRHQNKAAQEILFTIKKIDTLNSKGEKKNMDKNCSFQN